MAVLMRFLRFTRSVPLFLTRPAILSVGKRTLYAESVLGLDGFVKRREKASCQFHEMKDRFFGRMQDSVKADAHGMVFTEDLKNVIYLAEENPEEIALVVEMLKKFNAQNKDLRFGNFIFGPIVMRLLYMLDQPDMIASLIKDPGLQGLFDQVVSFTLAMDLLFTRQRYEDLLDVFGLVQQRQINSSRFPRDPTLLALGACYKMNTAESLKTALDILRGAKKVEATVLRKGVTFASGLALKQKDPHLALEILSICVASGYFTVRNLRALALAEMDRVDEIIIDMKSALERDIPEANEKREFYCKETLDAVKAAIERQGNKEHSQTLQRLERSLQEHGWICWSDIDSALCSPITSKPEHSRSKKIVGFESNFYAQRNYSNHKPGSYDQQRNAFRQRKGLHDYVDE